MAKLVECDRCGATERLPIPDLPNGASLPYGWIRFGPVARNFPNPLAAEAIIEGGEFCKRCADALRAWRREIPRAKPAD